MASPAQSQSTATLGAAARTQSSLIDLSRYDNSTYVIGRPFLVWLLWYFFGAPVVESRLLPFSLLKVAVLRLFGARIGQGVYIKPGVRVKFPWYLEIRDHCWIGEDSWIDNLAQVKLGPHTCISQGAYLCTGNHDWSSIGMDLFRQSIACERGSWVGAKSVVCPGVVLGEGAVLTAGSIATRNIPPFEIYSGNPACFVRRREIR